jgi:hypothetical protein
MVIPTRHLSVRVPWHDAAWNGKVCCNPRENGSCMFLPRINETKNAEQEEVFAEKWMHELEPDQLPPCVGEKVSFMSTHPIYKKVSHPYSKNENNNKFYGHYKETTYCYPGYSFSVIPYNWMLKNPKDNTSDKANELQIPYDVAKEPKLSFENSWVQQIDNQKSLLETFISPIQPQRSLVFIYAKNVPFVDTTSRILIGVGHISEIGKLTEYEYDETMPITFRSSLWERPVTHTIREGFDNGFLLPYQEFFKLAEKDDSIHIQDFIAFSPTFEEFSFGSEWVSNDSAIASLLILHEKLKKLESLLPDKNYEHQLKWIDKELSRLWKMRGPFPGLGAVLSGLKIVEGNLIAWELDTIIRDKNKDEVVKNPWDFVEKIFKGDSSFLSKNLKVKISDTQKATWNNLSKDEKDFLQLLSRMNLDNDQVVSVIDSKEKEQIEFLKNPYLLYENSRLNVIQFSVATIDKAIFSDAEILRRFPHAKLTDISTALDQRRIRAFGIEILEQAAVDGNTLLTDTQFVTKLDEQPLQPLCNPSLRNIAAIDEFLKEEITRNVLVVDDESFYFKLSRFEVIKEKIKNFVQKRTKRSISPAIQQDWLKLIENKFGKIDKTKPLWFQERDKLARKEKAEALNVLSNSRVSVLIGPAGTGKTTLLNILCEQPFISSGNILRLAPTGKARVNMGKDAKTLAQFLIKGRYNPQTGQYYINPDAKTEKFDTVIVDEASMLTEEQLAALLDSLTGVERFILVGDYRQLPPIGAGRPFVDIIACLMQDKKGIAELKLLFRQFSQDNIPSKETERIDVRLGRWFSDDEIKKQDVDIFKEIAEDAKREWDHIKFIEWHNVKHLEEILIDVTNNEIENLLKSIPGKVLRNPQANFDASLGSNYYMDKSNWSGFGIESAEEIENWQILSPTRTAGYGTKVLNQKIQKTFRGKTKEKAIFPGKFQKRKMNKPVGDDSIVYSDKIINTKNTRLNKPWNKVYNPNNIDDEEILKYIANGEIGIHVGKYGAWDYNMPRPLNIAFSSQPGYAYTFKEADFQEDGDIQMELAYSITVHKSQGSGFKVVLFILPNPCPVLSRELFYTALTRQEDRIVILHQGNFKDYQKFTTGEYSETGRRLTDLFSEPKLKFVNKKFYDTKYIQVSEKGEFMISKSEVIIADKLHNNKIQYAYEAAITDEKGITIHPDFTIEDSASGITYYWEHLGMLTKDDYRSKWKRKLEWYERNGIVDYLKNSESDKQLILTRDKPDGGIDSTEIKEIIEKVFK